MSMVGRWICALLLALGCRGAPGAVEAAVAATAAGLTASGVSRASGGCYASCPEGTVCDPGTGLCVDDGCGPCGPKERCERSGGAPRCVTRVDNQPRAVARPGDPLLFPSDFWRAARPPVEPQRPTELEVRPPVRTATGGVERPRR